LGIEGTCRLLRHLGMMASCVEPSETTKVCLKGIWLWAKNAGLWRTFISDYVKKGQYISSITDPYVEMEIRLNASATGPVVN